MEEINGIQINQYINGELAGEAFVAFEAKLKTDEDFRNKLEMHKEIDTVLMKNYLDLDDEARAKEKERLQPIFDEMSEKYFRKEKTIIRRLLPMVAFTAAAALLLFIFNPFANKNENKLSSVELADEFFEPYTQGDLMGSPGSDSIKTNPKQLLTKASKYFEENQVDKAIQAFQKVVASIDVSDVYKQKANWFLALCYLKQNQPEKAKPLLEELKQNEEYKEDAKAILKQIIPI